MVSSFSKKVLKVVRAIPKGRILSYQMVARKAGKPNAARAVGSIMKRNYDPAIPCHRVVPSSAFVLGTNKLVSADSKVIARKLGHYNRGHERKVALLIAEGAIK
ncbi:MAG: MGMT family protein [Patescibacteria group bacterium]